MSKWPWPHRLNRIARLIAFFLAAQGLVDRAACTAWLASGAGRMPSARANSHSRLETTDLVVGARLDQAQLLDVADQRRHAVIAQATGVEAGRGEGRTQGVHLGEWGQMRGVAEVVGIRDHGSGSGQAAGSISDDANLLGRRAVARR
jgi:hypothetical protein